MLCCDLCVSNCFKISIYLFRNYKALGLAWGTVFGIFYMISFVNVLRVLYLCSRTEPGIIPKLRSKQINYNKKYRVTYKTPEEVMSDFKK